MSTWSKIPGPKSRRLAHRLRRVESRNITYLSDGFPVFWESGRGSTIRDIDGNSYLDLTSAFGVASLGHSAPVIRKAIVKQSRHLWHGMGDVHPSAVKVQLLEHLAALAPGNLSVSILSSSGADAVESALKTAHLATQKPGILAFQAAYHGLTYGTLAVTKRDDFTSPFQDQTAGFAAHAPFPDSLYGLTEEQSLSAVEKILRRRRDIGAILIEPMQGRGGIRIPKPFFLRELKLLSSRFDVLLIVDEIYTGFGRTGHWFAVDHSHVVPDLMCVGKAMAGGFPISACIGSPAVMKAWPVSDGEAIHTSTFLGNPLGCAMALASLRELEKQKLAERSAVLGAWWKTELNSVLGDHPQVGEIRGSGLMIGIELVKDHRSLLPNRSLAGRVIAECLQRGLIVLSGGINRNVISLTPPLIIAKNDLQKATQILKTVLAHVV